jgi:uncharacterized protein YfaP (DUF2135 family)
MFRRLGLILLFVSLFAPQAFAAVPTITITSPTSGQSFDTSTSVITCAGTVSGGTDGIAELYLNGVFVQNIALTTSVTPATFSTQLVLVSGTNLIQVSDTNADGRETASVTVTSTRIPNDIRVNMSWNDGNSDVDLYLFCPADASKNVAAEVIWYADRNGLNGGSLDVDNVVGFGPENISFPAGRAPSGTYTGAVNLYARGGVDRNISARVTVFLNEGAVNQQTIPLDTFVVSVQNFGADVRDGESPQGTNSTSTIFFSFTFGSPAAATPKESVISFPNPFLPHLGGGVSIRAEGGGIFESVQILAIDGRVVRTLPGNGTSTITWDGRNIYGDFVASGVFFILGKFTNGTSSPARMTVVR